MQFYLKMLFAASVAYLVLFLPGCGGGSSSSSAQMRVINAFPSTPNVDALLDGASFAKNLPYSSATGYTSISTGAHAVTFEPTGTTTVLATASLTANASSNYTVIGAGLFFSPTAIVLTDDLSAPTSGDFKVRLVNASPSSNSLDVYLTAPGAAINTATPNASNIAYEGDSGYVNLVAGTYEIRVTSAGTKAVIFDSSVIANSGEIRSYVAIPNGGTSIQVVALADLN